MSSPFIIFIFLSYVREYMNSLLLLSSIIDFGKYIEIFFLFFVIFMIKLDNLIFEQRNYYLVHHLRLLLTIWLHLLLLYYLFLLIIIYSNANQMGFLNFVCYIVAWCNEGKMFCCNQYLIHIIVVVGDNIYIFYIMLSLLLWWILLLLNLSFFLYDPIDDDDSGNDNNADNIVAFIAVDSACVILVCSFSSFYS